MGGKFQREQRTQPPAFPDCAALRQEKQHFNQRGLVGDLHIKGLTLLWMCLCCLRPEEVAKVLPHSGQA